MSDITLTDDYPEMIDIESIKVFRENAEENAIHQPKYILVLQSMDGDEHVFRAEGSDLTATLREILDLIERDQGETH